ncbi:MAG TPA: hypothetical protein VE974_08015 [Thermoanaerobaculia bacterium]|nr:hypothetical protein [Thermoanaerobaculia bacterium]
MGESTLTAVDIVNAVRTAELSTADRVAIVRALRDTTPGLVEPDDRLLLRIRAARSVSPEYVDTMVNAMENSELWQQSADTTPTDLRTHRDLSEENRALVDEVQTYGEVLTYKSRYHHFLAVEKARSAYKIGKEMKGEAGLAIRAHISLIDETRRASTRRRRKPEAPAPAATATKP